MDMTLGFTRLIIETAKKRGILRNQCAYLLATAYHETAHTMKPVREHGGEAYLRSKKYYPYVGMGFVQLTWLVNYQKASKELGVDFVSDPTRLLDPSYSAEILVVGCRDGWFTGKKLADYMTLANSDFLNARRIINGIDKAVLIAGYAKQYDDLLRLAGYGETTPPEPTQTTPTTEQPAKPQSLFAILAGLFVRVFKKG